GVKPSMKGSLVLRRYGGQSVPILRGFGAAPGSSQWSSDSGRDKLVGRGLCEKSVGTRPGARRIDGGGFSVGRPGGGGDGSRPGDRCGHRTTSRGRGGKGGHLRPRFGAGWWGGCGT